MLRIPLRYVVWSRAWRVTESHRQNISLIIRVLSLMLYRSNQIKLYSGSEPLLVMGDLDTLTPARRWPLASTPAPLAPRSCRLASGQLTSGWLAGR